MKHKAPFVFARYATPIRIPPRAQSGMTVQIRTGPIPCALSHETTAQLSMAKCVNDAAALNGVLSA